MHTALTTVADSVDWVVHFGLNQSRRVKGKPRPSVYRGLGSAFEAGKNGKSAVRAFGAGTIGAFGASLKSATGGWFYAQAPVAMLSAGLAPRGHRMSTLVSTAIPSMAMVVGGTLGGGVGELAAGLLFDSKVQKKLAAGVQSFVDLNRNTAALNMGGGFRDSQRAYTMRQVALKELSGSLLNARQHLGKEAQLMHS